MKIDAGAFAEAVRMLRAAGLIPPDDDERKTIQLLRAGGLIAPEEDETPGQGDKPHNHEEGQP
jgi:hypothetical protein